MKLTYTIDINSKPEKVFYWLGTPEKAMTWMTNVSKTEFIKKTPDMVGTTFKETIEENGRSTEMHGTVTAYRENRLLAFHLSGQYNIVDVEYQLKEINHATRVTVVSDIRFRSFLKLLSIIMWPFFRKKTLDQLQEEFIRLKKICEHKT
jgi:uncharacterized protein YndB with AHSA1/START domain